MSDSVTTRDPFLDQRMGERAELARKAQSIKDLAADMNRPLTEDEITQLRMYKEGVDQLDVQVDAASLNFALDVQVSERLQSLAPGGVLSRGGYEWPSAGHGLWDLLHQNDREARNRYQAVQVRAAEHMGIGPVAGITPVAGSFENLHVDPNVGPILDYYPDGMPFLTAVGITEPPNAMSFQRPRIVDPNFTTGVGPQALQKGEVPSKHFTFETDTVSLVTTAGYLNISQQLLSLDPTALGTIIGQLNRRLANALEIAALTELALTSITVPLADSSSAAAVQAALADAAALVFTATGQLPSWIVAGPTGWSNLASLTDAAGRPLYPPVNPVNAQGSGGGVTSFGLSPMGLNLIVSPAITGPDYYVGNSAGFEAYVKRFPVLEAVEPSVLGRQVAVGAASAFYRPTTSEPDVKAGVVKVDAV
jgi:hypothetical protein